ncbi:hypothetical protein ANO14919_096740 [Xylariales sp. No.14919]|nr:hypothetical protein ANO14919_096740 [Xylariales sp. No.14919]
MDGEEAAFLETKEEDSEIQTLESCSEAGKATSHSAPQRVLTRVGNVPREVYQCLSQILYGILPPKHRALENGYLLRRSALAPLRGRIREPA